MTVPVLDAPPITVVGSRVRPVTAGGLTVKFTLKFEPEIPAVMAALTWVGTATVEIVNEAPEAPAGTVIVGGTVAVA